MLCSWIACSSIPYLARSREDNPGGAQLQGRLFVRGRAARGSTHASGISHLPPCLIDEGALTCIWFARYYIYILLTSRESECLKLVAV